MIDGRTSYTAANAIPVKLLMNESSEALLPIHISWYPTNVCNLACEYCSCGKRQKNISMDYDTAITVIHSFADIGCQAVSISGGGEPLCHPMLADMIAEFHSCGIKIGMVTNGTLLDRLDIGIINMLQWCRISCSSPFDKEFTKTLDRAVAADVDWAFSHVIGSNPKIDEILKIVAYAEWNRFTHVRLVGNLKEPYETKWLGVKQALAGMDRLVIYQERKRFVPSKQCLVGYVKPLVAPDWKMYLCCGVQYALEKMTLDNPPELCMGDARELESIYGGQRKPFPVKCVRCYYNNYNVTLKALTADVLHKEFV